MWLRGMSCCNGGKGKGQEERSWGDLTEVVGVALAKRGNDVCSEDGGSVRRLR